MTEFNPLKLMYVCYKWSTDETYIGFDFNELNAAESDLILDFLEAKFGSNETLEPERFREWVKSQNFEDRNQMVTSLLKMAEDWQDQFLLEKVG